MITEALLFTRSKAVIVSRKIGSEWVICNWFRKRRAARRAQVNCSRRGGFKSETEGEEGER